MRSGVDCSLSWPFGLNGIPNHSSRLTLPGDFIELKDTSFDAERGMFPGDLVLDDGLSSCPPRKVFMCFSERGVEAKASS